jgi:uncharacterized protein YdhG (YjbR/CyaY superfamily)
LELFATKKNTYLNNLTIQLLYNKKWSIMNSDNIPKTIDEYIAAFPMTVRNKLTEMRLVIKKAAPDADEKISYRMPAFVLKGMLVYFAAHKNHIGFYPFTSAIKAFRDDLTPYHTSKGGIQFPHDTPLPVGLIRKMIEFRVRENLEKATLKNTKQKSMP